MMAIVKANGPKKHRILVSHQTMMITEVTTTHHHFAQFYGKDSHASTSHGILMCQDGFAFDGHKISLPTVKKQTITTSTPGIAVLLLFPGIAPGSPTVQRVISSILLLPLELNP